MNNMSKMNGFAKGVAVGAVAVTAIGLITAPKARNLRSATSKFIRTASDIIDDVSNIWR